MDDVRHAPHRLVVNLLVKTELRFERVCLDRLELGERQLVQVNRLGLKRLDLAFLRIRSGPCLQASLAMAVEAVDLIYYGEAGEVCGDMATEASRGTSD